LYVLIKSTDWIGKKEKEPEQQVLLKYRNGNGMKEDLLFILRHKYAIQFKFFVDLIEESPCII